MEKLELILKVYKNTLASEIEDVKFEDIPKKISETLSKVLKTEVDVCGNGITENCIVKLK